MSEDASSQRVCRGVGASRDYLSCLPHELLVPLLCRLPHRAQHSIGSCSRQFAALVRELWHRSSEENRVSESIPSGTRSSGWLVGDVWSFKHGASFFTGDWEVCLTRGPEIQKYAIELRSVVFFFLCGREVPLSEYALSSALLFSLPCEYKEYSVAWEEEDVRLDGRIPSDDLIEMWIADALVG